MLPYREKCAVSGKEIVQINGYESAWGYAQSVRVGPFIFVSGSVSADAEGRPTGAGDMAAQVANAYAVVAASLAAFGAGMSHIVQERLVTTDLRRFLAEGTQARKAAYAGHSLPASSAWTETVRLAQAEFLFEVEVTAYLPVGA
jgi:2-iminobutanoate/2-iminopropanoate deaminase